MYTADIAFSWSIGNKIVAELQAGGYLIIERNFSASVYHCTIMNSALTTCFIRDHLTRDECEQFAKDQHGSLNESCWKPMLPATF